MINAIIVDDEFNAIKSLKWELGKYSDSIKVIDTFTSPIEAISGINYLKPDCLFLDIEMPEMNGFSMLNNLSYNDFAVVITTAYNQYAIQAIKQNALDYLLKPIDGEEVELLIQKLLNLRTTKSLDKQFESTVKALSGMGQNRLLQLPVNGKVIFVKTDDVIYCESDGNYSKIFLENGKKVHVSKKLKEIEEMLPENLFCRVHNSFIVHLLKVSEFMKGDGYLVLVNDKKIPVSRLRKDNFLKKISSNLA